MNFVRPAKWILDLTQFDEAEINEYVSPPPPTFNIGSISLALTLSDDIETIESAFISARYHYGRDLEAKAALIEIINEITDCRWKEMMRFSISLMRECIRLLEDLVVPPIHLIEQMSMEIMNDLPSVELLTNIWIKKNWVLFPTFVYTIQKSYSAWKFLRRHGISDNVNLKSLMTAILKHRNHDTRMCLNALLGTNGSVLEYVIRDQPIEKTIKMIDDLEIWPVILCNPAIGPILDYCIDNYNTILEGVFDTMAIFRDTFIPLIETNKIAYNYVTIDDIEKNRLSPLFFKNPSAISLIQQWLNNGGHILDILNSLVSIAASSVESSALIAIDIINTGVYDDGQEVINELYEYQWLQLMSGPYAKQFVMDTLTKRDYECFLGYVLERTNFIPYWQSVDDTWVLFNLNAVTVQNIKYNSNFREDTEELCYLLTREEWAILFKTDFGVKLGIRNIGYVIDNHSLSPLFASPHITKDQLIELHETTDIVEYADDEEFYSLISRVDASDINLKTIYEARHDLCLEILATWHEPSRLARFASTNGMDMIAYLNIM